MRGRRCDRRWRTGCRDGGATLPELLVVVVVLGLLAGAVVLTVRSLRNDASDAACDLERSAVERAALLWFQDHDGVPATSDLHASGFLRKQSSSFEIDGAGVLRPIAGGICDGVAGDVDLASMAGGGRSGGSGGGPSAGGAVDVPVGDLLEVSLTWTGNADLDVWARMPDGTIVSWAADPPGGGGLEVDVVPAEPSDVGPHVERIIWPPGTAPAGVYEAWAEFRTEGWGLTPAASFEIAVRLDDTVLATVDGALGAAGTSSAVAVADVDP